MATQSGPITKIYQIEVLGLDNAKIELSKMGVELDKLKKKKQDLDKEFAKASNVTQAAQVNQQIQAQVVLETELTKKIAEKNREIKLGESLQESNGATGVGAAIVAYQNLVKQYKEALATSQEMEAQFGKESAEAIEAARTAAIYEAELVKINKLRNQAVTSPENIPFTSNLAQLEAEQAALKQTGTVVSEFDLQQRDAANAATALGQTQLTTAEQVQSTSSSFTGVIGSLDQYTGSLRDNIRAQLENAQAIAANKAAQKDITNSIKESGSASASQIEQLTALKEEAVILDQSQKSLTTTIRNQAREFVAANGSIEEGRAKINQLQQAYAQLSEAERAQPFGQGIKDEIDILEPKIKELEAQIGLFQRNVGNYPTAFTGAFKVLETELNTLHGKLVQGNFSGKELDELTRRTATLKTVTADLNQTFKSTTQEQTAYKEAARQVAQTFGTESTVFQTFSKEVGAGNAKLKETDVALNVASGSGKKAAGVFQTLFSGLRNIANIVPGLGLSGLILLLIAPLEALAVSISNLFNKVDDAKERTKALNDVNLKSIDIFNKEKSEMEGLVSVLSDNTASTNARKEALQQLIALSPEYLRGLTLENINTAEGTEILKKYTAELQKKADVQAAIAVNADASKIVAELKAEKTALQDLQKSGNVTYKDLTEAQQKFIDNSSFGGLRSSIGTFINASLNKKDFTRIFENIDEEIKKGEKKVTATAEVFDEKFKDAFNNPAKNKGLIEQLQKDISDLTTKRTTAISKAEITLLNRQIESKQKELDILTAKPLRADKLSTEEQNSVKIIDATYKTLIAVENERFNDIEKVHTATFEEEITHAKNIRRINVDQLNSKIALLSGQKSLNAEELATLAEYKEKRSAIELQTSQQIQEIEKKRFADQNKGLEASLEDNIKQAKEAQKAILNNPDTSNIERARASLEFIDTEIIAYQQYYTQLLGLNGNFNKEELQKVRDHLRDLKKERSGGQRAEVLSTEKDIQAQGEKDITQINIEYGLIRNSILNNEKITSTERQRLLENLANANKVTILSKELETLNEQLKEKFTLLLKGLVSEEEYEKLHLAAINKAGDLEAATRAANQKKIDDAIKAKPKTVEDAAAKGANKLLGIDEGSAEADAVAGAIAGSFALATDAMHNYYDAERQRIQDSLALNLERLDQEKQQVEARAQSQAEIDSIEKQYAQKKKDAQKAAGEEIKKSKRAELKIALVTEIANDAVAAAAYPFPFNLGIFAVMAGLAYGRYALGLSQINAQQFEKGGQVPRRGGKFGGKRHSKGGTPFKYHGEEYEAEVDELAIIRTRNAPARNKIFQIAGTHQQIASQLNVLGGGVSFAPGAKLKRFETGGFLGTNLQAPVFVPSSNNGGGVNNTNSKELLDAIKEQNASMNIYAAKIDNWQREFEVRQVTSTVTKAQQKQVQQKAIGTL